MSASLNLRYGKLRLKTLSLVLPAGSQAHSVQAQVEGKDQAVSVSRKGDRITLAFSSDVNLSAGQTLSVTIAP